jgi:glucosamine-6-phosphate deaminase
MHICIYEDVTTMGMRAAEIGAQAIRQALDARGNANIIIATGASQFTMLDSLVKEGGIDWSKVNIFHLDEYVGMSSNHPASFRKYLKERVADKLPALKKFEYVGADAIPLSDEIARLSTAIRSKPIDVAFIGIGENGHLAFNDPPADFETEDPYIVVDLDEKCRLQQVGEGWFKSLAEVPAQAVSMSIKHILKSKLIVCTVPDERKSTAVEMALTAAISPEAPCSILRNHPDCYLVVDMAAASRILKKAHS